MHAAARFIQAVSWQGRRAWREGLGGSDDEAMGKEGLGSGGLRKTMVASVKVLEGMSPGCFNEGRGSRRRRWGGLGFSKGMGCRSMRGDENVVVATVEEQCLDGGGGGHGGEREKGGGLGCWWHFGGDWLQGWWPNPMAWPAPSHVGSGPDGIGVGRSVVRSGGRAVGGKSLDGGVTGGVAGGDEDGGFRLRGWQRGLTGVRWEKGCSSTVGTADWRRNPARRQWRRRAVRGTEVGVRGGGRRPVVDGAGGVDLFGFEEGEGVVGKTMKRG